MRNTIELSDGYVGNKVLFFIEPIEVDGDLVKLQCAELGKEYMVAWKRKSDLIKAIGPLCGNRIVKYVGHCKLPLNHIGPCEESILSQEEVAFCAALEKRPMSSWSEDEMDFYNHLTGQKLV
jgi:hypothetical protein